jgi:hypothetical protein
MYYDNLLGKYFLASAVSGVDHCIIDCARTICFALALFDLMYLLALVLIFGYKNLTLDFGLLE